MDRCYTALIWFVDMNAKCLGSELSLENLIGMVRRPCPRRKKKKKEKNNNFNNNKKNTKKNRKKV